MSQKALDLVRKLKHLPGKHPQRSHAGGRGSGGSSHIRATQSMRGSRQKKNYGIEHASADLESAIEYASSEDMADGLREARNIVDFSKGIQDSLNKLELTADVAEQKGYSGAFIDGIDQAYSIVSSYSNRYE